MFHGEDEFERIFFKSTSADSSTAVSFDFCDETPEGKLASNFF